MTKTKRKPDGDKKFVFAGFSRGEVWMSCGHASADRLTEEDMEHLAHEMAEACGGESFAQDLQDILADKFTDSSGEEEE